MPRPLLSLLYHPSHHPGNLCNWSPRPLFMLFGQSTAQDLMRCIHATPLIVLMQCATSLLIKSICSLETNDSVTTKTFSTLFKSIYNYWSHFLLDDGSVTLATFVWSITKPSPCTSFPCPQIQNNKKTSSLMTSMMGNRTQLTPLNLVLWFLVTWKVLAAGDNMNKELRL